MKKRALALMLTGLLALGLTACGSTDGAVNQGSASAETETSAVEEVADMEPESLTAEQLDELVTVDKEYTFFNEGWGVTYHFYILTNHAPVAVDVYTSASAYTKDGSEIGSTEGYLGGLGAGETSLICEFYDTTENTLDQVEYTKTVSKSGYTSLNDKTDIQVQENGEKLVITAENQSDLIADIANVYCLFFKDGQVCGYGMVTCVDDTDYVLSTGASKSGEITLYSEYDSYQLFPNVYSYESE